MVKMATDIEAMLSLTRRLQPWRSPENTRYLDEIMRRDGVPFCESCADWHYATEEHSGTYCAEHGEYGWQE